MQSLTAQNASLEEAAKVRSAESLHAILPKLVEFAADGSGCAVVRLSLLDLSLVCLSLSVCYCCICH